MSSNSDFKWFDSHVEKDYVDNVEGTEYLLEDIENEFENPDDVDWSLEAITEYARRQYNSDNPNEVKINELITRWLERISDKPEQIERRKIQLKKLVDKIKKEFDNCDESEYSSEISHIQDKKIDIRTKDKAFTDEAEKFIKETVKKAFKKDGRFESVRYLLAQHGILSMEDDVPMLEDSDDGISLTCPYGEDYFDYQQPTITNDELAKGLLEKIRANYPNEIQITFDDLKDIIEDMHDENERLKSRIENYRITPPENYDPECFQAYDDMRYDEQTKWVINGLMEKYKDQPKVLEKLRMIFSKLSSYDKEFTENCSFTFGKEYIDKYLYDVLLYYIQGANIDLESISLECYEESVANLEGHLKSSDFIDLLPKDFIEKMDMAYDYYDPEGKPNQYADALSELIVKYCRNSKGEQYKLEDVKRSFARSYEKRTSKAISRLSKDFEEHDDTSMKR